jgi:hypothetical protein
VLNFDMKATKTKFKFNTDDHKSGSKITYTYPVYLRCGDQWYNGTSWEPTKMTFDVEVEYEDKDMVGVWGTVKNDNNYNTGLGNVDGKLIKAPTGITVGDIELTICDFKVVGTSNTMLFGFVEFGYLKNISLEMASIDKQAIYGDYVDKDSRNDAIYEREIEGDYVEKADEVNLNICTKVEGKICLSSVFNTTGYIEEIKYLGINDKPEHHILNKIIRLYSKPRFVINPTLSNNIQPYSIITDANLPGTQFIVGGGEEDVKMERMTVNLIQI